MRKSSLLLTLALTVSVGLLSACGSDTASKKTDEKVVKVGTSAGRSPFIFKEGEKVKGFDAEIIEEAAKKAGYKVEWNVSDFEGLFGLLDSGRIDTIANELSVSPERKKKYDFSVPYVYSGSVFAVKKDNNTIKSLEDLKGKTVGVGLGTAGEQELKALNKNNVFTIKTFSEDPTAELNEVGLGRVDAYYNDKVQVETTIKKADLDNVKVGFGPLKWGEIAFPFAKKSEKLEDINKALKELEQDGTLSEISKKWLKVDATKKQN
ncbi:amino acid ABC transporter substrate-binding protein [Bacillus thuringiensis]|uniref:amino acid ABC transporter substrate-binding protein n=1 Tax=Bacillus thuringiensis TaxID=1428 RepID=UPI0021E8D859|nr:amino acid ABC transporter substrate-binding protein [Bacillus thuringiensis]